MFMLRSIVAILFAMFLANGSVAADPEETNREMERTAAEEREKLVHSILSMFVQMSDDDPVRRRTASEAFHAFRITAVQMKLFAEEWHFAPADANDRERTVAIYGHLLHAPLVGCGGRNPYESAWNEYCRLFEDKSSRIRTIAFTHAARSIFSAPSESAAATLRGCRDPEVAVRSQAFRYLTKLLRYRARNEPYVAEARDCVVKAIRNDRAVDRDALFHCAEQFGTQVGEIGDDLLKGMHDRSQAAAEALARVDPTPDMIERVIADLRDDDAKFRDTALSYFARLSEGPACPALVRTLDQLLDSPDSRVRSKVFQIVLDHDYSTLHPRALLVAEALLNDPDFYEILDPQVDEAIVKFARQNAAGMDLFRKCLRHRDENVAYQFVMRMDYGWRSDIEFVAILTRALLENPHPNLNDCYSSIMRRTWERVTFDPMWIFTPSSNFTSI